MLGEIWKGLRDSGPLVHCITNFVSANDVANGLLAVGASPVMARHQLEVESFARRCDALLLNLGTPDEHTGRVLSLAGAVASQRKVPVVLDPVGVASSELRRDFAIELLKQKIPSIVRGNGSEISSLATGNSSGKGVDCHETSFDATLASSAILAAQGPFIVVSSGAVDIIRSENRCCFAHNGHIALRRVTGTGCLLSALIAACAALQLFGSFEGSITACCAFGICAERAWKKTQTLNGGTMTFRHYLIDCLSQLTPDELEQEACYEIQ